MNKIIKVGSPRNLKGVGLIEVLVALVVVSFGVLGMASLQLTSMKHSSGGFNRSKAMLYAQGMATRIRLNPVGVDTFAYGDFNSDTVNCSVLPLPYCQARSGIDITPSCAPDEIAAFDLYSVACGDGGPSGASEKGVVGTLPNGELSIVCDPSPCETSSAYQVTVAWSEGRSGRNNNLPITRRVQVRMKP